MNSETPTQAARRICRNWMSPVGDAHYRDVLNALQNQCDKAEAIAIRYAANNSTGSMGEIAAKTIALAIRSAARHNKKVSDSPPMASNNTKTANGEFAAPLG